MHTAGGTDRCIGSEAYRRDGRGGSRRVSSVGGPESGERTADAAPAGLVSRFEVAEDYEQEPKGLVLP
jgi:hypothetical protein